MNCRGAYVLRADVAVIAVRNSGKGQCLTAKRSGKGQSLALACWNQGGMDVSPKGHLAVSCTSFHQPLAREAGGQGMSAIKASLISGTGKPYAPQLYPGRVRWQEIHIWDKHGKMICEDAVPGLHVLDGLYIDREDALYVMAGGARVLDGKRYSTRWPTR